MTPRKQQRAILKFENQPKNDICLAKRPFYPQTCPIFLGRISRGYNKIIFP